MKTRKCLLFVVLFLFILLTFTGCGKQVPVSDSNADAEKEVNNAAAEQAKAPDSEAETIILKAKVEGNVENELEFIYSDFLEQETMVMARYQNCKETMEPREYTGIPVALILEKAKPLEGSTKLTIVAVDDYKKDYVLEDVLANQEMLISRENGCLEIIMDGEDASYWVRDVVQLIVQ